MKPKNTSSNVLCSDDLYNFVFEEYGGNIDTSIPLPFIYLIEQIMGDDDKITFFNVDEEKELFDDGFSPNGSSEINIDNLDNVRVKQYIKKTDDGDKTVTADISQYRLKNHKYSKYLANIIVFTVLQLSIFPYEKISEILNLFFNINISRQRVYDLYAENVKEFINKNIDEIQQDIRNGNMLLVVL